MSKDNLEHELGQKYFNNKLCVPFSKEPVIAKVTYCSLLNNKGDPVCFYVELVFDDGSSSKVVIPNCDGSVNMEEVEILKSRVTKMEITN